MKFFRKKKFKNDDGIRSAVVGTGYLGRFHAEKYYQSPDTQLVGVVDVNSSAAEKCASALGVSHFDDYRELPELGVKCASVASTTSTHFEISSYLLKHGIDVLVEKPMAVTTDEAEELIQIAKAENRILQVGHIERFNPSFIELKKHLSKPRFFEVRRIARFAGRGHDVDVVMDLMIHDIDLISFLVDRPIIGVEAIGIPVLTSSFDVVNARLTFEGGAVANVTASRAALKTERTMRVFQHDTYVSADFQKRSLKICTKNGESDIGGFPKISVDRLEIEQADALKLEVQAFIHSAITREASVVPGEDGLRALLLAERIQAALRTSWQTLEDDVSCLSPVG